MISKYVKLRPLTELSFKMRMDKQKLGVLKFICSDKATKFCEIFPLHLTTVHTVKSKGKISQNFVAFSEYMNFTGCSFSEALVLVSNLFAFFEVPTL